jgi:hypothetical protein
MMPVPVEAPGGAETPRLKDSGFVRIKAKGFFGPGVQSPDGRFLLAWRSPTASIDEAGVKLVEPGHYLLYEGADLRAEGRLDRPDDGKVANTGRFVFNDRGNFGELSGTFHAFDADGTAILRRAFSANLSNNGLSDDGRLAVCQACNAPGSPDSSMLIVFDLDQGSELHSWDPRSGWADSYAFSAGGEEVALSYYRGGTYRYTLDGVFLDEPRWISDQLREGSVWIAKEQLLSHGDALPASLAADMITGFEARLRNEILADRDKAHVLRLLGECRETQGDAALAMGLYEEAITLDPKVGLKRRVEQMRRAGVSAVPPDRR